MALSIKSREGEAKARQFAALTGLSITAAILSAVSEKIEREQRLPNDPETRLAKIRAIADHCSRLPVLDARPADEIIGYDKNGIPA
jgi:antitoxin VapB